MQQADCRRLTGKRITLLIVTGLLLAFIFVQSMLPRGVSAEESEWLADKGFNPLLQKLGLKPITQCAIRKTAHVAEFAMLSALLVLCFRGRISKSAGFSFAAAFLDESIQLVSGREALVSDIWIDLIGIAAGSLVGFLIYRTILRRHEALQKRDQNTKTGVL